MTMLPVPSGIMTYEQMGNRQRERTMVYYTADLHLNQQDSVRFDHENDPSTIPLMGSVEDRDSNIIRCWNDKVSDSDDVYVVGDFALAGQDLVRRAMCELNGRKHIIMGNHDAGYMYRMSGDAETGVVGVSSGILHIRDNGRDVVMCHYPMMAWDMQHKGAFHVYGHVHATQEETLFQELGQQFASSTGMSEFRALNAGCMLHSYTPQSLDELCSYYNVGGRWENPSF